VQVNEQPAGVREQVRAAFAELADTYRTADGTLEVPVSAVLAAAILR
jgi:hypothetical protein